jgi:hypothetical protein
MARDLVNKLDEELSSLFSGQNTIEPRAHDDTWSFPDVQPVGSCELSAWRSYFPWIILAQPWPENGLD